MVIAPDAPGDGAVAAFVERLHADRAIPEDWPEPARCPVEAGVDGGVATLTCRDEANPAALRAAVEERMAAAA